MSFNPIVIVGGEPKSVFLELFLKAIKKKKKKFSSNNFNYFKRYIAKKY